MSYKATEWRLIATESLVKSYCVAVKSHEVAVKSHGVAVKSCFAAVNRYSFNVKRSTATESLYADLQCFAATRNSTDRAWGT